MPRYLLLVPDGVAVRNFLCSRFVDRLLDDGPVTVWHALPEAGLAPHRTRWPAASVRWRRLPAYREGALARVLRQAKVDAQLIWQRDRGGAIRALRRTPPRLGPRLVAAAAATLGRIGGHRRGVVALDRAHARAVARDGVLAPFLADLADQAPDVVFCTHQRAGLAVPAMLAARRLGIPTATFVYSWDNLPKGRMAVHSDHFLVWSEHMREELLGYYPEVAPPRVHAVGTPQFEHYVETAPGRSRADFLTAHGLDPARPTVCFSGDDVSTSPHDPQYLADLAEALAALPAGERPQILFRPCPVDRSERYAPVLARHPEIALSKPRWQEIAAGAGDWTQVVPTAEDVALLAEVVASCDAVVNLGSTMAMDFAIRDKPAIYLAYEPEGGAAGRWRARQIYRLPHFRTVHELDPVHWAWRRDDLAAVVLHALAHPGEKAAARRAWLERLVCQPLDQASARCADALRAIAA